MEWVFDGIGTEIISLLAGFLGGGFIGYKIGIKNKISQRQKRRESCESNTNWKHCKQWKFRKQEIMHNNSKFKI